MRIDALGAVGAVLVAGGLVVSVARCRVVPGPVEPPKPEPVEAARQDDCTRACANLAEMRCEWAEPTPGQDELVGTDDDGLCVDVCRAAESTDATLNPRCVSVADSCEAAEACVR